MLQLMLEKAEDLSTIRSIMCFYTLLVTTFSIITLCVNVGLRGPYL